jgi:uncharacterized protein
MYIARNSAASPERRWSRRLLPIEAMQIVLAAARNWRLLLRFLFAPKDGKLAQYLGARPEVWEMLLTPYLAACWGSSERLKRVLDHCDTCERLGPLLTAPWDGYVVLALLPEIGPGYRLILDQPRWLLREGQSAISLWDGGDRLFSLSYCLSSEQGGLLAYVGGLQGRTGENMLDRYRKLTKSAHGMRPSDLMVELFRRFCMSIGIKEIFCVSDEIRQHKSGYYRRRNAETIITRQYDTVWTERGAKRREDGFFALPTATSMRPGTDIPRNKRAMYRRRYNMLDAIGTRIAALRATDIGREQILVFGEEHRPIGYHRLGSSRRLKREPLDA